MTGKGQDELRKHGEQNQTVLDNLVNNVVQPALLPMIEKGMVPDSVVRFGMRRLLKSTLNMMCFDGDVEKQAEYLDAYIEDLKTRGIAEQTDAANEQHYEVPAEFFNVMMGKYLKYSSGYWPSKSTTLDESEEIMLKLFCERGELDKLPSGSTVLDLGCGWGSLSLYAAKHFPNLKFTGVSNSNSQREFIMQRAKEQGLSNVEIRTCDINVLEFPQNTFDRVMSVECFEHMKNYQKLFKNVASWMKPKAKAVVHIFVHKDFPYHFTDGWMSEKFFSGGQMPSKDLFLFFNDDLRVEKRWLVNGTHYSKTLEAWLARIDVKENRIEIENIFEKVYGKEQVQQRIQEWRLFNMACSELFAWNGGNEWLVAHYRFVKS